MKKPSPELQAPETGSPQTMKILIPLALLTGVSGPLQAATTTGQFDDVGHHISADVLRIEDLLASDRLLGEDLDELVVRRRLLHEDEPR